MFFVLRLKLLWIILKLCSMLYMESLNFRGAVGYTISTYIYIHTQVCFFEAFKDCLYVLQNHSNFVYYHLTNVPSCLSHRYISKWSSYTSSWRRNYPWCGNNLWGHLCNSMKVLYWKWCVNIWLRNERKTLVDHLREGYNNEYVRLSSYIVKELTSFWDCKMFS